MLLQSKNVSPPPSEPRPDFVALARDAASKHVENQWFKVPASKVVHGFSDPENDEGPDRFFAWDNERPPYEINVPAFEAQGRPVSNGEYATYLLATSREIEIPVTWTKMDVEETGNQNDISLSAADKFFRSTGIKTVFGPVPLTLASDWPCMASYNEAHAYAEWAGYRIPTFDEVRSIQKLVEARKSHCDGLTQTVDQSTLDPEEIFVDLEGCNIGLQHFHPMPVTQNGGRLSGLGDMGGAWEWTSSVFAPFEGFKPMDIYPGYSGALTPISRLSETDSSF